MLSFLSSAILRDSMRIVVFVRLSKVAFPLCCFTICADLPQLQHLYTPTLLLHILNAVQNTEKERLFLRLKNILSFFIIFFHPL